MFLQQKYGSLALVAGASEGIGEAFSRRLASEGMDLILIARRKEPLDKLAEELRKTFSVQVECIYADLSIEVEQSEWLEKLKDRDINVVVYNAAMSYIGRFEESSYANDRLTAGTNMMTPLAMLRVLGKPMLAKKKGAFILMASLAGFQGSGFLAMYAATKAFTRILAESLWFEWKDKGVDVIAVCAGATSTPNFIATKPEKTSLFAPRVQSPEEVVEEAFKHLGKRPSVITGFGNRLASFLMQKIMPRKMAILIMGDTTRKMYRIK